MPGPALPSQDTACHRLGTWCSARRGVHVGVVVVDVAVGASGAFGGGPRYPFGERSTDLESPGAGAFSCASEPGALESSRLFGATAAIITRHE